MEAINADLDSEAKVEIESRDGNGIEFQYSAPKPNVLLAL